jgi:Ca2+-binding EF-hand superfamily protein
MSALKHSLAKCDPNIDETEIEDMVESIDKFHRGMLSLDDFVELFQKTFELLYFHKDINGKYKGRS